jgi:hypothetical protein
MGPDEQSFFASFCSQKEALSSSLGGAKKNRQQGRYMIAPAVIFVVRVARLILPEPHIPDQFGSGFFTRAVAGLHRTAV